MPFVGSHVSVPFSVHVSVHGRPVSQAPVMGDIERGVGRRPAVVGLWRIQTKQLSLTADRLDTGANWRVLVLSPAQARTSFPPFLAAYPGPSSLSSSPRARTSLLTPTAIICHPVISLLRSTLSSNTCAFTDEAEPVCSQRSRLFLFCLCGLARIRHFSLV